MIRPTIPDDAVELIAITNATDKFRPIEVEALAEVLHDYFARDHKAGHVCVTFERDRQVLGFAYYAPAAMTDRGWYLWWIVVKPGQQGGGIGGKLLKHVEDDIRRQKGRIVFIETGSQPHYEPTRRFYVKHGYELDATLRDFYAAGDSMVVFRKALE
jgi:GNAT superfamily N-acetyltransferase